MREWNNSRKRKTNDVKVKDASAEIFWNNFKTPRSVPAIFLLSPLYLINTRSCDSTMNNHHSDNNLPTKTRYRIFTKLIM